MDADFLRLNKVVSRVERPRQLFGLLRVELLAAENKTPEKNCGFLKNEPLRGCLHILPQTIVPS